MAGRSSNELTFTPVGKRRCSGRTTVSTVASLPDQLKSTAAAAENDDDDNEKGKITIAAECRRGYAVAVSEAGRRVGHWASKRASASMIYQWRPGGGGFSAFEAGPRGRKIRWDRPTTEFWASSSLVNRLKASSLPSFLTLSTPMVSASAE